MNDRLVACPACARHIRITEASCPFCSTACPESLIATPAPAPPRRGLSRADLYRRKVRVVAGMIGSGAALTTALSCSSDDSMHSVFYGAAPDCDGCSGVISDADADATGEASSVGFDGAVSDASAPSDAGAGVELDGMAAGEARAGK